MTSRGDFYDDKRKERKVNFLEDVRVIRRYFCRKHDLTPEHFEFLCKLHGLGTFIMADFHEHRQLMKWNKSRWNILYGTWIITHRERKPSAGRNYKIYKISPKAKRMIEECYDILCGKKGIPEELHRNPMMREDTYNDKRYAKAVRQFNEARNNK